MPDQYVVAAGGNWSAAATWESAPGAGDDTGPPLAGHDTYFIAASGDVLLDVNSNALLTLTMTGYAGTLDLSANTLDVDGNCLVGGTIDSAGGVIEVSGDFEKDSGVSMAGVPITLNGLGIITCNGAAGGAFSINTGNTHTAADAFLAESISLVAGTYNDGGFAHTIAGNIDFGAGVLTSSGIWTQSGTGTVEAAIGVGDMCEYRIASGVTATTAGDVYCKKFGTTGAGDGTLTGTHKLEIYDAVDNFWAFTGTCNVHVEVYIDTNRSTGGPVTIGNSKMFRVTADNIVRVLTIDGDLTISGMFDLALSLLPITVDMNGYAFKCNQLRIGTAGANAANGILKCGEASHYIGSGGLADGNDLNVGNEIQLESCYLECASGTLDFDNIAHSAGADDLVHIVCTGTGEVKNFDPAQIVHCHGDASVDGGGNNGANNKTTFNTHAPPGSLQLLGAGV